MEIKIGKSLKSKSAGTVREILKKRYLDPKGPYAKLVKDGKAEQVTVKDIDACISENFKKDEGAEKLNTDGNSKGDKPKDRAPKK